MRKNIIFFLKQNPSIARLLWRIARFCFRIISIFVPVKQKSIMFCSLGGRNFGDNPKAIYDEICRRKEFDDWSFTWAFIEPESYVLERGDKIRIDTLSFFMKLLSSRVWVSNSGMDRGIDFVNKKYIRVETWHGTPFKKIGGEEHHNSLSGPLTIKSKLDTETIRCAQSDYDRQIYARINNADINSILLCDLPRNDSLLKYPSSASNDIKKKMGIPISKKVILYAPTYREYLINDANDTYIKPPIDFTKWENLLGNDYVLLLRAHYAVTSSLDIPKSDFIMDMSNYPNVNDLYIITDILISDYSSVFLDYSILNKPMLCFAYDYEEYEEKRGLYINLKEELPCEIDYDEDSLLDHIIHLDFDLAIKKSTAFHNKYAPYAGNASKAVVDAILSKL